MILLSGPQIKKNKPITNDTKSVSQQQVVNLNQIGKNIINAYSPINITRVQK